MAKTCCKCHQEKPISEFGKQGRSADGLRGECRLCRIQRIDFLEIRKIIWRNRELEEAGRKICQHCRMEKEVDKFYLKKDGKPRSWCSDCEMELLCKDRDAFHARLREDAEFIALGKLRCLQCHVVKMLDKFYMRNGKPRRPCKECCRLYVHRPERLPLERKRCREKYHHYKDTEKYHEQRAARLKNPNADVNIVLNG